MQQRSVAGVGAAAGAGLAASLGVLCRCLGGRILGRSFGLGIRLCLCDRGQWNQTGTANTKPCEDTFFMAFLTVENPKSSAVLWNLAFVSSSRSAGIARKDGFNRLCKSVSRPRT